MKPTSKTKISPLTKSTVQIFPKGKWKCQKKKGYYPKLIFGGRAMAQMISVQMSEAEGNATGNLISASLDMYDALKKIQSMLKAWEDASPKSFNKYMNIDAHIATDKAVAKAEGKPNPY